MKEGQLIAVHGGLYEYGGMVDAYYSKGVKFHQTYIVDIDEDGRLTATGITVYFTDEELSNRGITLTEKQWCGVVECIIRQNYDNLTEEEIAEATEDIVYRCFIMNMPQFDELEEYIACYMNR